MVLHGWAPWCPLTPLDTTVFSRLKVERRVWLCPHPPLDTAVFARLDGGGEGPWCPLIPA